MILRKKKNLVTNIFFATNNPNPTTTQLLTKGGQPSKHRALLN